MPSMRRIAVLAAALAAVSTVAPAAGAGARGDGAVPPPRELAVQAFRILGAPDWVLEQLEADDADRDHPFLRRAGDLDGDGRDDVISGTYEGTHLVDRTVVITGRRGFDGEQLFRTDTGVPGQLMLAVPTTVGTAGDAGVLVAVYTFTFGSGGSPLLGSYGEHPAGVNNAAVGMELHLIGIRGDGVIAWSRSFTEGLFAYTGSTLALVRDLPILAGTLDAAPGGATDIALGVYQRTPTSDSQDDSLRVTTVDGTDGGDAGSLDLDIDHTETTIAPGPDLDGDGLDDVLVHLRPENEAASVPSPTLVAVRGSNGSELWRSTAYPLARTTLARSVGDVSGDGGAEVAVGEPGLRGQSAPPRRVVLLDGASGATMFDRSADTARALGDIDEDGLSEVLLSTSQSTASAAAVLHQAVDGDGNEVYERSYELQGVSGPQTSLLGAPGDVDADGVPDLTQQLSVLTTTSSSSRIFEERVLSGLTGETLRVGGPTGGLGVSLDGLGDDVFAVTSWGSSVFDVTAADGLTGDELFTMRLRPRGDVTPSRIVTAADVTGDGTPDLIVSGEGRVAPEFDFFYASTGWVNVRDAYVLDGKNGAVLWGVDPQRVPPEPDRRGAVSPESPLTWQGTAATGSNVYVAYPSRCSSQDPKARCEHVLVEMTNPPADGAPSATATATVTIDQFGPVPEPFTDLDLMVYESDELGTLGPFVGESVRWLGTTPRGEQVTFELQTSAERPSRFYLVRVIYFASAESGYRGSVILS